MHACDEGKQLSFEVDTDWTGPTSYLIKHLKFFASNSPILIKLSTKRWTFLAKRQAIHFEGPRVKGDVLVYNELKIKCSI